MHSRLLTIAGDKSGGTEPLELHFGHEGVLYKRSFVMYDRETDSKWNHSTGLAMKGPLKGSRLTMLPARVTSWQHWREQHPDTSVFLGPRNGGFMGTYLRKRPAHYGIAVSHGLRSRLYPFRALDASGVLNDRFDDTPYVAVFDGRDARAFVFHREIERRVLTFDAIAATEGGPLLMRDRETQSVWRRLDGRAIRGELAGKELAPAIGIPWLIERWRAVYGEGASEFSSR